MSSGFFKENLKVENRKCEEHHWKLNIQVSLGTKFQLKRTILIFSTKFAQKGVFPVKNGKSQQCSKILHFQISLGTKFQL